ncbi:hypothetical protein VOLCADRAFT_121390 [Volvox carteri f. nagariensis]|uniref:Uncharacterized protein n=1 Tax=Volvox carteri f. nagariensis TaxID=3068 RepID=D8U935_VOLCA|nr:uncharacterized protein VOLCADRAFT_121390 [Volvox carteri f. nagariensis]EFJ43742.1 hypothetical protein VOLCADRAFT_121390 [Volvox carteri f. nagariensis]|eukprot:XP_002955223.1 hypothetical protein VOLCADRAFT_121390 [Volvox carteri f. nagariensis]
MVNKTGPDLNSVDMIEICPGSSFGDESSNYSKLATALKGRTQQRLSQLRKHLQLAQYHAGRLLELELRAGSHHSGATTQIDAIASTSIAVNKNSSNSQAESVGKEEGEQQEEPPLHMHRAQASHHEAAAMALLSGIQQQLEKTSASASARHFHRSATASDSSHYTAREAPPPTVLLHLLPQCLLARLDNSLYPSPDAVPSASTITSTRSEAMGVRSRRRYALLESRLPVVSLLVQYFQRPWMLPALVKPFRRCATAGSEPVNTSNGDGGVGGENSSAGGGVIGSGGSRGVDGGAGGQQQRQQQQRRRGIIRMEMLINVDSRSDAAAVAEFAAGPLGEGFVIPVYSNNDDDVFPEDTVCDWLSSLVRAFRRWRRMGAIGSQRFVFDYHPNTSKYGVHFWDPGAKGGPGGGPSERPPPSPSPPPPPPLRMQFVTLIDYAPIAVSYMELPGLNKDPQESEGGTHRRGVFGYCWERQWELAIGYMGRRWGHHCRWEPDSFYWFGSNVMEVISEHVRQLNLRLLRPIVEPSEVDYVCPFGYGCGEVPYDNITGIPGPVHPPFGNLTTWPKRVRMPRLARRRGTINRGGRTKAAVAMAGADRTA